MAGLHPGTFSRDLLLDSILASAELQRNVPCLEPRGSKVNGDEVSRRIKEEGVVSEDFQ